VDGQGAPSPSPGADVIGVVYFSSVSENTRRFVERLEVPALRIPLRPHLEGLPTPDGPFVLVVPTYGGGHQSTAVPRPVVEFLREPRNRALLRGVVASGNRNFGEAFCLAGRVVAARCGVPLLHRFELLGTPADVRIVKEGLDRPWLLERARSSTLAA
jgi:protein involved in ribonucleotide reduction